MSTNDKHHQIRTVKIVQMSKILFTRIVKGPWLLLPRPWPENPLLRYFSPSLQRQSTKSLLVGLARLWPNQGFVRFLAICFCRFASACLLTAIRRLRNMKCWLCTFNQKVIPTLLSSSTNWFINISPKKVQTPGCFKSLSPGHSMLKIEKINFPTGQN